MDQTEETRPETREERRARVLAKAREDARANYRLMAETAARNKPDRTGLIGRRG